MRASRWLALAGAALLAVPALAQEKPALSTPREKGSYSIGVNTMSNLRKQGLDVDLDLFLRGMKDAAANGPYLISEEEIRIAIKNYQTQVRRQQAAVSARAGADNKREAEAFFAANKTAPGVVTLPSGLQYKILAAGAGKVPADTDTVSVNFRGTLLDGTEFNRTAPGKPTEIKVAASLPAWKEALKLMPAGSTWRLFVPAALAYGARGNPGTPVGPDAALIFDLELVSVK